MKREQANYGYDDDFIIRVKKNGGISVTGTFEFSPVEVMGLGFIDQSPSLFNKRIEEERKPALSPRMPDMPKAVSASPDKKA
jgi:Icc-related predicted phosphoesterase